MKKTFPIHNRIPRFDKASSSCLERENNSSQASFSVPAVQTNHLWSWGGFLKVLFGGIAWVTLMSSRFLVMLGEEENRMCYFWTGWDSAVLFGGICLAGGGLAILWKVIMLKSGERGRNLMRRGAVFLTCFGLMQLLPVRGATWLSWVALGAGILLGMGANWQNRAVWSWTTTILLSLSSLFALFVFQACQWESFAEAGGQQGAVPSSGLSAESPSVILMIFDSVGAEDLYEPSGGWKEAYPAFAAFGQECVTFADAESPGIHTGLSIPGIVLQRPMAENAPSPWRYWREVEQSDSWLLRAKDAHHARVLIADYLPWGMILQERADYMSVLAYNGFAGLPGHMGRAIQNLLLAVDAIHAPWGRFWNAIPKVRWWAGLADVAYRHRNKQNQWMKFQQMTTGGSAKGLTMLFHSDLTHDSDYLEDGTLAPTCGTPESELTYVDREFGSWVAEMKRQGKWDDIWVLLTADHSKGQGKRHRHVPFAVKAPKNIGGGTWVTGTLPLCHLTPFLKSVYGDDSPTTSLSILSGLVSK